MQNLRRIGSQAVVVFKHKQDVEECVESLNEKEGILVSALKWKNMWYLSKPSSPLEMRLSPDIHTKNKGTAKPTVYLIKIMEKIARQKKII